MEHFIKLKKKILRMILSSDYAVGDVQVLRFDLEPFKSTDVFFLSSLLVAEVHFQKDNVVETWKLIVKLIEQTDELLLKTSNMFDMFYNEVFFYNSIATNYAQLGLFPKYYFGQANGDLDDCVILENLAEVGFRQCREAIFLDDATIELIVINLGRFHGHGYVLKETSRDQYDNWVAKIKNIRRYDNPIDFPPQFANVIKFASLYGLKHLRTSNAIDSNILDSYEAKFHDIYGFLTKVTTLKEPLSTIVHGDFNRNNILLKYSEQNQVTDIRFVDFQMIRCGSPALDLAFILYMNVSKEQLSNNFDKYFDQYHNAVLDVIRSEIPHFNAWHRYSRQAFLDDFLEHALYSYTIVSFFLPIVSKKSSGEDYDFMKWHREEWDPERIQDIVENELVTKENLVHIAGVLHDIITRSIN